MAIGVSYAQNFDLLWIGKILRKHFSTFQAENGDHTPEFVEEGCEFHPLADFYFKQFDSDNNGQLTKEDLQKGIAEVIGQLDQRATLTIYRMFNTIDSNQDGFICQSEFRTYVAMIMTQSIFLTKASK